jgi:hypothetical protein
VHKGDFLAVDMSDDKDVVKATYGIAVVKVCLLSFVCVHSAFTDVVKIPVVQQVAEQPAAGATEVRVRWLTALSLKGTWYPTGVRSRVHLILNFGDVSPSSVCCCYQGQELIHVDMVVYGPLPWSESRGSEGGVVKNKKGGGFTFRRRLRDVLLIALEKRLGLEKFELMKENHSRLGCGDKMVGHDCSDEDYAWSEGVRGGR